VRNLCEQVVYSGNGNKVWVRYVVSDLIVEDEKTGEEAAAQQPGAAGNDTDLVLF